MRPCAVAGCPSTCADKWQTSHRFPKRPSLAQRWQQRLQLENIPLPVLQRKYVVCTQHFDRSAYRNPESKHLNVTALPRALDGSEDSEYVSTAPVAEEASIVIDMETEQQPIAAGDERLSIHEINMMLPEVEHSTRIGSYAEDELLDDPNDCLVEGEEMDNEMFCNDEQILSAEDRIGVTVADGQQPTVYLMNTDDDHHDDDESGTELNQDSAQTLLQPTPQAADILTTTHKIQQQNPSSTILSTQPVPQHHHFSSTTLIGELPEQLLNGAALHVSDDVDDDGCFETDINGGDQYVYVLEMNMPVLNVADLQQQPQLPHHRQQTPIHSNCGNRLPEVSIDTHAGATYDSVTRLPSTPTASSIVAASTTLIDQSDAISNLLSALTDTQQQATETTQNSPAIDDDEEPYALHDTVEVRLYNEMSKRSLIQLLVAANGRIRDLEQRVATMEAVHARVLGSLDMVRSVLKR